MDRKSDNFITAVNKNIKDIEQLKSTQFTGDKSFINYDTYSDDLYDLSVNMNTEVRTFRVTFTHSQPDKYNIVTLSWFMRVDNSNVMANPVTNNTAPYYMHVISEAPQLGATTWLVNCTNNDYSVFPAINSHTFYFKFYFNGTVDGTFSTTVL